MPLIEERKMYKTKLCVLFRKGRCPRQTCRFAHGDAELRRFNSSFNGRRDYREIDPRDKVFRRRSPYRRLSPGRDSRGRHSSQGYSPPKLTRRTSDNKRKTRNQSDGQSDDFSESLETSYDETESRGKTKKQKPSESNDLLDDKLRGMQSEIDMLDDRKYELEIILDERIQEADELNSRIKDLQMQLHTEKEECRRVSSTIKKFIRAHNCHSRLQDELKRSEARLNKLGEKIFSDANRPGGTEEDDSLNMISDEEKFEKYLPRNPRKELQIKASPFKKRVLINEKEDLNEGNPAGGERSTSRLGKNVYSNGVRSDKVKVSERRVLLPSTSMAAEAETEETPEKDDLTFLKQVKKEPESENNDAYPYPLPPPPSPVIKSYLKYEDDNETVDVDGLDDEDEDESGEVDID